MNGICPVCFFWCVQCLEVSIVETLTDSPHGEELRRTGAEDAIKTLLLRSKHHKSWISRFQTKKQIINTDGWRSPPPNVNQASIFFTTKPPPAAAKAASSSEERSTASKVFNLDLKQHKKVLQELGLSMVELILTLTAAAAVQ
jgi:hypothetical protein